MNGILEGIEPHRVEIDWVEYYRRFKQVHGDPVLIDGRLLFPDGWRYASASLHGPEYQPPTDPVELEQLRVKYWKARKKIVDLELWILEKQLESLKTLQGAHDVPIPQYILYKDEYGWLKKVLNDDGTTKLVDLDLQPLELRIQWLREDLKDCKKELG